MVDRPTLNVAVAGRKSKASDYNENFDKMMGYVEDNVQEMNTHISTTLSVYEDVITPSSTSGNIILENNKIYRFTPTGDITFQLPTIDDDDTNKFNQILVQLNMDTLYNVTFSAYGGFNNVTPQIITLGKYNVIYEHDGAHWYCGVMERSAI